MFINKVCRKRAIPFAGIWYLNFYNSYIYQKFAEKYFSEWHI